MGNGFRTKTAFPLIAAALLLGTGCIETGLQKYASGAVMEDCTNATPEFASEVEDAVFRSVNAERISRNVQELARDAALDAAAKEWAGRMASERSYGHNYGHDFAENVAFEAIGDFDRSSSGTYRKRYGPCLRDDYPEILGELLTDRWMSSRGHRGNLLDEEFGRIGIGVKLGREPEKYGPEYADFGFYAVQNFD